MSISKDYNALFNRGVEEIIVQKDLEKKIKLGKKLRIKHGVDPTTKDLHLGHAVPYQKLREFQELGHTIIFLIGDFTGRFGDPSDKLKTRQMRDKKEVRVLAKDYLRQVGKILDIKKTEIRYNSEWYDKMSAQELLSLLSRFTVARMLERDMFTKRIKNGDEIGLHEPAYPVLQAYDSVMLKSDLTVIGTDQKFNELQGRKLQVEFGQKPQDVMTVPMLIGTDGKMKMSQSLGNEIGIGEKPFSMFSKVMSIPDKLISHYFELAARTAGKELEKIKRLAKNPANCRDLKISLARDIVSLYHGASEVSLAEEEFIRVFKNKELPLNIPQVKVKDKKCDKIYNLLVELKLSDSKSEARRLIEQGGVRIDEAEISDREAEICLYNGMVIQVGKRKFVKIAI